MDHLDNDIYRELHQKLLHQPTRREREQKKIISDLLQFSSDQREQRQDWNKKEIHISYSFESGPKLDFKRQFRSLWKKHFIYAGSPLNGVTLKIATQTNKSLSQLLIKKKPPRSMLTSAKSINIK
ncbi:unnamed protein product [Adineta steineri]|uniref:Uncharacterized protein n=1 Tax=Adineta steineri TaxID=433720 RepID=A0A815IPZ9_9BILA|nr:unnamed protein product [Adineta steineri]CAF1603570.1 unnamed protein product [Adineta steineri]